jgi:AcrR family transcriptional regulator
LFRNTVHNSIAKQAGVGVGTLYRHFPNREALIDAAYQHRLAEVCERAAELVAEHTAADATRAWIEHLLDYATALLEAGARTGRCAPMSAMTTSSSRWLAGPQKSKCAGAQQPTVAVAGRTPDVLPTNGARSGGGFRSRVDPLGLRLGRTRQSCGLRD